MSRAGGQETPRVVPEFPGKNPVPQGLDSNSNYYHMTDSAITLLGRDPKESKIGVYTNPCICKFIAALTTIDKRWKQLKCLPADKG